MSFRSSGECLCADSIRIWFQSQAVWAQSRVSASGVIFVGQKKREIWSVTIKNDWGKAMAARRAMDAC